MSRTRPGRRLSALATFFLVVGCSGDSSPVEPGSEPIRLAVETPSVMEARVADTLTVTVVASRGTDPVAGVEVDAVVQQGGGALVRDNAFTGLDGRASFSWILGTGAGTHTLVMHGVGVADTTGLEVSADAAPGPAAAIRVDRGPADTATVATEWPIEVRVVDRYDNPISGLDVGFEPSAGSIGVAQASTNGSGVAQTTWMLGTVAEEQLLVMSADTVEATLTVVPHPGPLAQVRITPDSLFFDSIGAQQTVTAAGQDAYGNDVVATPTLALDQEVRWSPRVPVVDAGTVEAGVVRSLGAGSATIRATAPDGTTATIPVRVVPPRPQVHEIDWPDPAAAGDEIVMHGYRVDEIDVLLDGTALSVSSADSALVRVVLPGAGTCRGAASTELAIPGADVHTGLGLIWQRAGEIDLTVGQSLRVSSPDAACLQLSYHPGAEYVLAFLDDDRIVESATTAEPNGFVEDLPPPDTMTFDDRTDVAAAAAPLYAAESAEPGSYDVVRAPAPRGTSGILALGEPDFRTQVDPWAIGDRAMLQVMRYTFVSDTLLADPQWGEEPGTVIDILGNGVVLFLPDADSAALDRTPWQDQIDGYRALFGSTIEPVLDAAYGPLTNGSSGNQQVVVVVGETVRTLTANDGQFQWMQVRLWGTPGDTTGELEFPLPDFDQQAAHAWQLDFTLAACTGCEGTRWSHTGGAMVIEAIADAARRGYTPGVPANIETYYRRADIFGWGQNTLVPDKATWVFSLPYGYSDAQLVMDDFLWRLLSAGVPFEEAIRVVLQGALTGWYGLSLDQPGNGLVDRMQAKLGPAWSPTDGVLAAVASVGADDRTAATEFQQPWNVESWKWTRTPWVSAGEITAGQTASKLVRPFGLNFYGYFHILDGRGASFATTASRPLEWLLVRTR